MVEQERAKVHLRVVRFVAKVILGPSHSVVLCTLVYNFSFRRPLHACLQLQAAPQSVTVSFFQRPPHRLVADRVHDRQRDQLVGQELHRPLVAARRRRRAGQSDEPGLGRPIAFALAAGPLLLLATQGVVQALLDEALADALDGSDADLDRLADALVGPGRPAVGGVGLEQDAGAGELLGGGLAGGDQGGQLRAFLGGQRNLVLLHGVPPETVTAAGEPTRMHQASQKWPASSRNLGTVECPWGGQNHDGSRGWRRAYVGGWRLRAASSWRMARISGRFMARAATVARPVGLSGTTLSPTQRKCSAQTWGDVAHWVSRSARSRSKERNSARSTSPSASSRSWAVSG